MSREMQGVADPFGAAPRPRLRSGERSGHALLDRPWTLSALAAVPLVLSTVLPEGPRWIVVLAAVILLGVPHGALDTEIVRPRMRQRFGPYRWFLVFGVPYLSLSAAVLIAWRMAPLATLTAFFAVTVWHFGSEDAGPDRGNFLDVVVRGALPIAAPVLLRPKGFARVFAVVTGTAMPEPPAWLSGAAWVWAVLAAIWLAHTVRNRRLRTAGEAGALVAAFALLPPLNAFALYFVCLHAPRHMTALARNPRLAPRVASFRDVVLYSLPVAALTFALGAGLWPLYAGPTPERLLALTIQGLAALTLPHVLLDFLVARWRCGTD